MITRGSKFFYGGAAFALLTALIYGFITGASAHGGVVEVFSGGSVVDSIVGPLTLGWKGWVGDQIGYSVLMGMAAVMAAMGGFQTAFRDGDAEGLVEQQGVAAEQADLRVVTPQGLNFWPVAAALAGGMVLVGRTFSPALFVLGLIVLAVVAAEWTIRAWSERLSDDPANNAVIRAKLMYPIEIPFGAILAIALVMFLMSRILLALPPVGAVFVIILIACAVFGSAQLLSSRPHLKRPVVVAVVLIGALLLIGGGIAGGMVGTYNGGEHESQEGLSAVRNLTVDNATNKSVDVVGSVDGY